MEDQVRLGAHESIAGGFHRAIDRAKAVGCEVLQLFVKSSRSWHLKPISQDEVKLFKEKSLETAIYPVSGHASYLINLAAPQKELWRRSINALIVELERCEILGLPYLVLHPGSHLGAGEREGLKRVAKALGEVHRGTSGLTAKILLESTAGQGTALGHRFEHLGWLMENTPQGDRLGVCIDTCHIFASGYDIRTPEAYEATMAEFDRLVGFSHLRVIHFNDSKGGLGSHLDRHEHIGKGELGIEAFRHFINDSMLPEDISGILETPKGDDLHEDRENLSILRSLVIPEERKEVS
ncbi:MAG: deoxyribonuclease IV [Syntrophobacterales bacterium]|nr:deoxyribonuclease IV [Syntrophobacterales bacterium]